ncbi:unnamed protein product [Closterium sp. NIES-64]|nr:unnamed protein product [Closterium sp. NIES-64]
MPVSPHTPSTSGFKSSFLSSMLSPRGIIGSWRPTKVGLLGGEICSLQERYLVKQEIGSGSYGMIRAVREKATGKTWACKGIDKDQIQSTAAVAALWQETKAAVAALQQEVAVMRLLKGHAHVVEMKETVEDDTHVHIIMELCKGGDPFDRIKQRSRYEEKPAVAVLQQLSLVLRACHSLGVMHRDVKPENLLLCSPTDDVTVKVTDFGIAASIKSGAKLTEFKGSHTYMAPEPPLSTPFSSPSCSSALLPLVPSLPGAKLTEFIGSHMYMAPEVINKSYSAEADVWSAGVVLYILLAGVPPFWASTESGVLDAIVSKPLNFSFPPWPSISTDAKDLIKEMLKKDPAERITLDAVLACLLSRDAPFLLLALYPCSHSPPARTLPLLALSPCSHSTPTRTLPLLALSLCSHSPPARTLPLLALSPCSHSPPARTLPLLALSPCSHSPPARTLPLLALSPCSHSPPARTLPLLALSPCSHPPPLLALTPCSHSPPARTLPLLAFSPCSHSPPARTLPLLALSPYSHSPPARTPPLLALYPCSHSPPARTLPLLALSPCSHSPPARTLPLLALYPCSHSSPARTLPLLALSPCSHSPPARTLLLLALSPCSHSPPACTLPLLALSPCSHSPPARTPPLLALSSCSHSPPARTLPLLAPPPARTLPLLALSPCSHSPPACTLPLLALSPCSHSPPTRTLPLLALSPCSHSPPARTLTLLAPPPCSPPARTLPLLALSPCSHSPPARTPPLARTLLFLALSSCLLALCSPSHSPLQNPNPSAHPPLLHESHLPICPIFRSVPAVSLLQHSSSLDQQITSNPHLLMSPPRIPHTRDTLSIQIYAPPVPCKPVRLLR